jgi:hypothetical protein
MSNQTGQSEKSNEKAKSKKQKTKNKRQRQNKTIYKYADINHSVNRGRRCKNVNPQHKE